MIPEKEGALVAENFVTEPLFFDNNRSLLAMHIIGRFVPWNKKRFSFPAEDRAGYILEIGIFLIRCLFYDFFWIMAGIITGGFHGNRSHAFGEGEKFSRVVQKGGNRAKGMDVQSVSCLFGRIEGAV